MKYESVKHLQDCLKCYADRMKCISYAIDGLQQDKDAEVEIKVGETVVTIGKDVVRDFLHTELNRLERNADDLLTDTLTK